MYIYMYISYTYTTPSNFWYTFEMCMCIYIYTCVYTTRHLRCALIHSTRPSVNPNWLLSCHPRYGYETGNDTLGFESNSSQQSSTFVCFVRRDSVLRVQ